MSMWFHVRILHMEIKLKVKMILRREKVEGHASYFISKMCYEALRFFAFSFLFGNVNNDRQSYHLNDLV